MLSKNLYWCFVMFFPLLIAGCISGLESRQNSNSEQTHITSEINASIDDMALILLEQNSEKEFKKISVYFDGRVILEDNEGSQELRCDAKEVSQLIEKLEELGSEYKINNLQQVNNGAQEYALFFVNLQGDMFYTEWTPDSKNGIISIKQHLFCKSEEPRITRSLKTTDCLTGCKSGQFATRR